MTLDYHFEGRVALVTGASHGIGRAIAEALARSGARVHATYRTRCEAAEELADGNGCAPIRMHALDVRSPDDVDRVVRSVVSETGSIDLLVNNAGITRDLLLGEMDEAAFDDVIATNLLGPFYVIRAACRPMMRRRSGAIVNVSSVAGERPEAGQSNYAASKGGLNALTRALCMELGPRGIRVNAVAPGIIPTTAQTTNKNARLLSGGIMNGIPLRRFGGMEEVAQAVLWLLSDAAAYVTGAVVNVSGGYKA